MHSNFVKKEHQIDDMGYLAYVYYSHRSLRNQNQNGIQSSLDQQQISSDIS